MSRKGLLFKSAGACRNQEEDKIATKEKEMDVRCWPGRRQRIRREREALLIIIVSGFDAGWPVNLHGSPF